MATEVAFYVRRGYKNGKTWIHKNIIPAKVTAEPPSFREQIERGGGGKGFLFFFCYSEKRGVVHRFQEMSFDDLINTELFLSAP